MSDEFAWTVPLLQASFGMLFLVAYRAGAAPESRHWAVGFGLSAIAFAASLAAPLIDGLVLPIVADVGFACAFYFFGCSLTVRYGRRDWLRLRQVLLVAAITTPLGGMLLMGSLRAEVLGSDLGCAAQILFPLAFVVRWPERGIDRALIVVSWLVVGTNLCRTLTAPLPGGAVFPDFPGTAYSYLMYADAMITGCAFASLALVAVTADLLTSYRRDAHVDPLTGLLNRRGFDATTAKAHAGGIVACDLDHFKRVNDAYGHDVGDQVLTSFSRIIIAALPDDATAARIGGEEFVVHLPGASLRDSEGMAVRLRSLMAAYDWSAVGLGWQQSASFGVAAYAGGLPSLADAISSADAQLYEAKRRGRNRVQASDAEPITRFISEGRTVKLAVASA